MDKPTNKQLEYIRGICEYLELELPNITTKESATRWLQHHVPVYKRQQELDSLYWEANHSELCNNYGDWRD